MAGINIGRVVKIGEKPAWQPKEGPPLCVSDMDDEHLRNTILMLQRWHENIVLNRCWNVAPADNMDGSLDHARMGYECLGPEDKGGCNVPVYPRLLEEALRRGIRIGREGEEERMSEFKINVVRIGEIEKHPNADNLSITRVHGGYPCIFRTGGFQSGDLAVYVPIDSSLPELEVFSFLTEGERKRLRAKRLRGIFSMGLLVPAPEGSREGDDVQALMGITKWEAPIDMQVGGECEPAPKGWDFITYTDIEGLRRWPGLIERGEEVVITEKIHGCNGRYVHDGQRLWVGSRTQIKREADNVLWWQVAHELNLSDRLKWDPMKIVFGEVYGQVQDLKYNVQRGASFRAFDVFDIKEGRYLDHDAAVAYATCCGLEWVPILYRGSWDPDQAEALAEGKSTIFGATNVREGFVIKPIVERYDDRVGRVILKMHGQGFLLRKQV